MCAKMPENQISQAGIAKSGNAVSRWRQKNDMADKIGRYFYQFVSLSPEDHYSM